MRKVAIFTFEISALKKRGRKIDKFKSLLERKRTVNNTLSQAGQANTSLGNGREARQGRAEGHQSIMCLLNN